LTPSSRAHAALLSFPTRRSSDLPIVGRWRRWSATDLVSRETTEVRAQFLQRNEVRAYGHWLQSSAPSSSPHPVPPIEGEGADDRSEEHTSELQSRFDLVCRLLLE